jgi:hypothetical protein
MWGSYGSSRELDFFCRQLVNTHIPYTRHMATNYRTGLCNKKCEPLLKCAPGSHISTTGKSCVWHGRDGSRSGSRSASKPYSPLFDFQRHSTALPYTPDFDFQKHSRALEDSPDNMAFSSGGGRRRRRSRSRSRSRTVRRRRRLVKAKRSTRRRRSRKSSTKRRRRRSRH